MGSAEHHNPPVGGEGQRVGGSGGGSRRGPVLGPLGGVPFPRVVDGPEPEWFDVVAAEDDHWAHLRVEGHRVTETGERRQRRRELSPVVAVTFPHVRDALASVAYADHPQRAKTWVQ